MTDRIIKILIIVAVVMLAVGNAWGQCTGSPTYAIIGEGTGVYSYPISVTPGTFSSVSECIYKYDELQAAGVTSGVISSISYQCTISPGNSRKLTIYLAHVDTYFGAWNYDPEHHRYVTTGLTRVVNAKNITFSTSGWTEITFDNNFTYQGGQDLLVVVIDHTQSAPSVEPKFLCHSTSPWYLTERHEHNNAAYLAGTPYDTYFDVNMGTYNSGVPPRATDRPNIRFKVSKTTCFNVPTNIEYQEHPSSVDISWDANGASKWEIRYGTHGFSFPDAGTSVILNTNSCTLSGLTTNTQYDFYIRSICGSCNGEYTSAHSFVTLPSSFAACSWGIRVNIGDNGFSGGISQFDDAVPPFNTYKSYSYSQTIYTAEDFGIRGGTISGMTINQLCGGSAISLGTPLKIYMGHTDKNSFASTSDWVNPSTLQEVYSSSISLHDGLIHIQFSTPFEYDASNGDNLVVAFYDSGAGTQTSDTKKAYYSRTASTDNRTLMTVSNSSFTPCQNAATYIRQFYLSASFEICSPRPLCEPVTVSNFRVSERGDRTVKVAWNAETGVSYTLYYGVNDPNASTENVWKIENATSPCPVPRLTNGQTYKFAIKPIGDGTTYCEDNPLSPTVTATPNCE